MGFQKFSQFGLVVWPAILIEYIYLSEDKHIISFTNEYDVNQQR